MIHSDKTKYPANVIQAIYNRLSDIDVEIPVFQRRLKTDDSIQCIGVYPIRREIDEKSFEMGNKFGPTIEKYCIGIQLAVKNVDMQQGQADHLELFELVDDILYNDASFRLTLPELSTVSNNSVRRQFMLCGVENVRFLSTDFQGDWYYLATLEFFVTTSKSYVAQ